LQNKLKEIRQEKKKLPRCERNMQKDTQKLTKKLTHNQPKVRFVGYGERTASRGFIASVGSPSGRCFDDFRTHPASERSKMVTRVQTN